MAHTKIDTKKLALKRSTQKNKHKNNGHNKIGTKLIGTYSAQKIIRKQFLLFSIRASQRLRKFHQNGRTDGIKQTGTACDTGLGRRTWKIWHTKTSRQKFLNKKVGIKRNSAH